MFALTPAGRVASLQEAFYWNHAVALPSSSLVAGDNLLALELVNNAGSSDAFLDVQLELDVDVLSFGDAAWRGRDNTSPTGSSNTNWTSLVFDDSRGGWTAMPMPIGYNNQFREFSGYATAVTRAPVLLRRVVTVSEQQQALFAGGFRLRALLDDNATVFVNEQLVYWQVNQSDIEYYNCDVAVSLVTGANIVAAVLYNDPPNRDNDMFFDLSILVRSVCGASWRSLVARAYHRRSTPPLPYRRRPRPAPRWRLLPHPRQSKCRTDCWRVR